MVAWKLIFLLVLQAICIFAAKPKTLTKASLQTPLVTAIDTLISNSEKAPSVRSLQGPILRLVFHDCAGAGGCDGCINLNLPENLGLQYAVDSLEGLYHDMMLSNNITRADFWALAGIVAVDRGMRKRNKTVVLPFEVDPQNFMTGRTDCATAPLTTADVGSNFPAATIGSADVLAYFAKRFSFTPSQVVAIMGAHHVGKMHKEFSGFNGAWISGSGAMDGSYYRSLVNKSANWHQRVVNCSIEPVDLKVQWIDNRGPPCLNNLNVDMGLYKSIVNPQPNGASSCRYATCAAASTSQVVEQFAGNTYAFLTAFSKAYAAMTKVCGRTATGGPITCSALKKVV